MTPLLRTYRNQPSKVIWPVMAVAVMLLISVSSLHANKDSILQIRQKVADSLNAVLTRGDSIIVLPFHINMVLSGHSCDSVDTLPVRFQSLPGGRFRFRVLVRGAYDADLSGLEHPLVTNLNAYLNASWGLPVAGITGLLGDLYPDCGVALDSQRYYLYTEGDLTALGLTTADRGAYRRYIDTHSLRLRLLETEYLIDGISIQGNAFITFIPQILATPMWGSGGDVYGGLFIDQHTDIARYIPASMLIRRNLPSDDSVMGFEPAVPYIQYPISGQCTQPAGFDKYWINVLGMPPFRYDISMILNRACANEIEGSVAHPTLASLFNDFGSVQFTKQFYRFEMDEEGYLICRMLLTPTQGRIDSCTYDTVRLFRLMQPAAEAEYCEEVFCEGGEFVVDEYTGALQYEAPSVPGCGAEFNPQPVYCISFCDSFPCLQFCLTNVLAASAATFSDEWEYDTTEWGGGLDGANDYERGTRGRWRAVSQFAYRESIKSGMLHNDNSYRVYNAAGTFPLTLFNWGCEDLNDSVHWLRTTTATAYSPQGEMTGENDIVHIPSAALFGFQGSVPTMVAQNATPTTIDFESFEDESRTRYGDFIRTGVAHSGRRSISLGYSSYTSDTILSVIVDDELATYGGLLKFWIKTTYTSLLDIDPVLGVHLNPVIVESDLLSGSLGAVKRVAQTGEWALFTVEINGLGSYLGDRLDVHFRNMTYSDSVWLDDARIQPRESQAICHVYDDATLRLLASFDDQHFGVYYQYNGEGKLVRKLRETERGLRTIEEAQYHTPLMARGDTSSYRDTVPGGWSRAIRVEGPRDIRSAIFKEATTPQGTSFSFNALNLTLTPDGERIQLFGSRPMRFEELAEMELPSIEAINLPVVQKWRLLSELRSTADQLARIDSLVSGAANDTTVSAAARAQQQQTLEAAKNELRTKRDSILRQLGLPPEQLEAVLRETRAIEQELRTREDSNESR